MATFLLTWLSYDPWGMTNRSLKIDDWQVQQSIAYLLDIDN